MATVDPTKNIKSMTPVQRAIYAYTTPNDRTHDGWIKIGDTEVKADENLMSAVDERISQQTHTSDTKQILSGLEGLVLRMIINHFETMTFIGISHRKRI